MICVFAFKKEPESENVILTEANIKETKKNNPISIATTRSNIIVKRKVIER